MTGAEPAHNDRAAWNQVPDSLTILCVGASYWKVWLPLGLAGGTGVLEWVSPSKESLPGGNSVKMFVFNTSGSLPNQKRKRIWLRDEGSFIVFREWRSELDGSWVLRGLGEAVEGKMDIWPLGAALALGWNVDKLLSLESNGVCWLSHRKCSLTFGFRDLWWHYVCRRSGN